MNATFIQSVSVNLLKEWEQLWLTSDHANFVNSPGWFESMVEVGWKEYRVLTMRKEGVLVGIVGVFKDRKYGVNVWTLPTDFNYGDPILIRNGAMTIKTMLETLSSLGVVILVNMHQIHSDNGSLPYYCSFFESSKNYLLPIEKDENGQVKVNGRKKLLKEAKGFLEKFNLVTFRGYDKNNLDIAFQIDQKSEKHSRGYNTFSKKENRKFYATIAKKLGNRFVLNLLYFNSLPVVYEMGFQIGARYTGSQVAYNKKYAKYTPGKVSEIKVIEAMADQGAAVIDYGSGDSYIKRLITDEKRSLYTYIISKDSLRRLYLLYILQYREGLFDRVQTSKLYLIYKKVFSRVLN